MSNIKQMSIELANMIAAGEIVERPCSIVKELVENSIDATSTEITVELIDAGISRISITDNGIGMSIEDLNLSVLPHSTSKLITKEDLFNISSLGFRGEALPSILSISKTTLMSSLDGISGNAIVFNGNDKIEEKIVKMNKGTKIIVEKLFFNTPARLKHLSSEYIELSHITEYLNKAALSYPNIRFLLKNNDKVIFRTSGDFDILKIISSIYGSSIGKRMIEFNNSEKLFSIKGFTSDFESYRSNKGSITILVNNRIIKNQGVIFAITNAYKTFIPINKYPITVLYIDVDPLTIDVNIHPTKQEIRFTSEDELKNLITKTIIQAITSQESIFTNNNVLIDDSQENLLIQKEDSKTHNTEKLNDWDLFDDSDESVDFEEIPDSSEIKPINKTTDYNELVKEEPKYLREEIVFKNETSIFDEMHFLGSYISTYLLFESKSDLYLIDQHAANERIRYEEISLNFEKKIDASYDLLVPLKINYPMYEVQKVLTIIDELKNIGLVIEHFGQNDFIIRSIPLWIPTNYELSYVQDIIEHYINKSFINRSKMYDSLAKSLACKSSIKANTRIDYEIASTLIKNLGHCKTPYTCPHGRPIVVKFTKYEIEKLFKRVI